MKIGNATISSVFKGSIAIQTIKKGLVTIYEAFKLLLANGVPPITLQKCKGVDLVDYKIFGNSIQDGTPTPDTPIEVESVGEKTPNMIDYSAFTDRTSVGIIFKNNKDGTIMANGTNTTTLVSYNINTSFDLSSLEKGVEYYGSCGADKNETDLRQYLFFTIKNQVTGAVRYFSSAGENTKKFTLSENEIASGLEIRINIPSGTPTLIDNEVFKPILCKASEYAEYEPYGYRVPIKVRGKNLLDINSVELTRNCKIVDNGIQFTGSGSFDIKLPAGQYTISFENNGVGTCYLRNGKVDSGYISTLNTTDTKKTFNYTASFDGYLRISSFADGQMLSNIQIELGTEATNYEPYIEPIATNIYLDEPLRKIGDYKDYIDFKNQKVIRNIYQGKLIDVLGGSNGSQYATGLCRKQNGTIPRANYDVAPLSNCLKGYSGTIQALANAITFASAYSNAYVYFKISDVGLEPVTATTTNTEIGTAINNYIKENNIDLAYVLSTPTEENIELPNIPTHKGTTIIEIDTSISPSNMEVEYYAKGVS